MGLTEQALDGLIRRVMLDAARQEYGELMEELPEHTFSPAFERKMKKLVRRGNHPLRHRILRAAACLLLALLLSGCSVLALSAEAREAFAGWVREVYETSFVYRFSGPEPETMGNILYRPTYVPDGYRIREEFVTGDFITTIVCQNDARELTAFSYFPRGITPTIQILRDGSEMYKRVFVNGMSADLYLDRDEGEANVLIWKDEEEGAVFCVHSPLDETEMIKIAQSVEAVPAAWRPAWLPDGYEVFDETAGISAYNTYMSGGRMIDLAVLESLESAAIYVTPDEGDIEKQVLVSGRPTDLYLGTEGRTSALIWTDDKKGLAFALIADPEVTEEEILRIAESVRPALAPRQPHRPAWVPAKYVWKGKSGGLKNFELHYDEENGGQILFRYWADGYGGTLPDELREAVLGLRAEETFVNGRAARLYEAADGIRHLVWHGGDVDDIYWISAPLDRGELIKIARSVGRSSETSTTITGRKES